MADDKNEDYKNWMPSHSDESSPSENMHNLMKTRYGKRWIVLGVLIFCFASGFLGAWAAIESGFVHSSNDSAIIGGKPTLITQQSQLYTQIAQEVSPSVVSINTTQTTSTQDFFGFSTGNQTSQASGTGIIISKNGYILTNKHVIPDGTTSVSVVLNNGTTYNNVQVVARDPGNDLAFLKISNVNNLQPATIGDSTTIQVGQQVIAIGNALGQFQNTITQGIVSGIGRPIQASDQGSTSSESLNDLIQTDAAINPGNSGGPLLNTSGQVVGIDTAVASNAQGIGFAIPINDAKGLIESVIANGSINVPFLGVSYVPLDGPTAQELSAPINYGAYVYAQSGSSAVVSGSPADKAGIKQGDVITQVNGTNVTPLNSLSALLTQHKPGDNVNLTVYRGGKTMTVNVTLGTYPSS
ncbi:MAG TPA: trypsin-like peptidase domain-containing protein [Candidatus Saccharimonadales bacterium]|nr:trypsin-like peptidase domain-containing protein [Candidatus Saccharimonadales bacterium]